MGATGERLLPMRRQLLFLVALLLAIVIPRQARASDDVQYIVIKTATETVTVALADNPVITYANDQLIITTAEQQIEVSVADITDYGFTEEPSSIRNIEVSPLYKQGMVAFDHLKEGTAVMLCNAKGEIIHTTTAQADGTAVIDMHGLTKGVYIICSGKLSIKIINN